MTSSSPQPVAAGKKRKPFDAPGILRRRAQLLLAAGGILSLVLAPFFWLAGGASYKTQGVMLIDPGKEPTLGGREREVIPGDLGDYTRTLVNRILAGDVLIEALRNVPAQQWPTFLDSRRSVESNAGRLSKALKVKDVPRTFLINAELDGSEPGGLAPVLNSVMESFTAKLRREMEGKNESRLKYLREERDQINARIEAERARILELAEHVSNKAFLHESYTVHLSKLEQIQRLYWEAEALRAEKSGELQRALADQKSLSEISLQANADERVADNFGINRIEQWTYEQLQSLRSTIDGLTTNNEDRTYVETRMKAMEDYLTGYRKEVNETTIRVLNEKRKNELETEVIKARDAADAAALSSKELGDRLEKARQEASDTSEAIFKASDMTFSVTQLRERLTALNTRIDDCEMEAKAPLRISIDQPAVPPVRPASNSRPQLAILAIALSFGFVLGGIMLFEMLDDRIRGLPEVEAALGGSAPEPVPHSAGGLERVLIESPDSPAGKAIRALAVRLNREREKHQSRAFAFAGISNGVGNSALALNAAQALARFAGRVLLVRLSQVEDAPNAAPSWPATADAMEDQVARDEERGIDALVIQLTDALPAKIGLRAWLDGVRGAYDAVVLDLDPLPDDDLALCAVHYVDAVVFTVREDVTQFRELRRALDAAAGAGVAAFTAVLNASRQPESGWMQSLIQTSLRPASRLHHAALEVWRRRVDPLWARWRRRA